MQIDFSPLTVCNSVTNYTPLTIEKRNSKSGTEKKICFRGQFATRGHNSRSLTIWTLNTKRWTKKNINERLWFKNIELSFVDCGQLVDFKPIDREK